MRKYLILCIFGLAFVYTEGQAQRHIQGTNHIELQGGGVDDLTSQHYYGAFYYSHLVKRNRWWRIGVEGQQARLLVATIIPDLSLVPVASFYLTPSYFYTPLSLFNSGLYLNVGLGPVLGYERINGGNAQLNEAVSISTKSPWVAGGQASGQAEFFLNARCIITVNYSKRYLHGSSLDAWDNLMGLGLKFQLP